MTHPNGETSKIDSTELMAAIGHHPNGVKASIDVDMQDVDGHYHYSSTLVLRTEYHTLEEAVADAQTHINGMVQQGFIMNLVPAEDLDND